MLHVRIIEIFRVILTLNIFVCNLLKYNAKRREKLKEVFPHVYIDVTSSKEKYLNFNAVKQVIVNKIYDRVNAL